MVPPAVQRLRDHHFLLLWAALNLVQIGLTELTSDEGYYWFWSSRLQWGYYEHPPGLALLIRAGSELFGGEFGVRFFNVVLLTVGLGFFLRTMKPEQRPFAYAIALGLPLLNFVAVIAWPDAALLGLSGIALYVYQRYLRRPDLRLALLLAVLVALMFYVKYHTILFVALLVLSNLRLLRNPHFHLAAVVVTLLYVPHLLWLHAHGWPAFVYHLSGAKAVWTPENVGHYGVHMLIVIGVGLVWIPFVIKTSDAFERTLKFMAVGVIVFFALNATRRYIHFHWPSLALLPTLYLGAKYYAPRTDRMFPVALLPYVGLVLVIRLYLAFHLVFSTNHHNVDYFHGRELWAADVRRVAGDRMVVFETGGSGIRESGLYRFYAGAESMALYPGERKKSQYQLWNYEDRVQGSPVLLITEGGEGMTPLETRMGKEIHYRLIDRFVSYNNIHIEVEQTGPRTFKLWIRNHRDRDLAFRPTDVLFIDFRRDGRELYIHRPLAGMAILAGERAPFDFALQPGEVAAGRYRAAAGFLNPYSLQSFNSRRIEVSVGSSP